MKVGIIGAGTWGMALARMLSVNRHNVCVWSAISAEIDELEKTRRQKNLPNMEIPREVDFTKKLNTCVRIKIYCYLLFLQSLYDQHLVLSPLI